MQKTYMITGGQGYLGKKLTEQLIEKLPNNLLLILDIRNSQTQDTENVKYIQCDITNKQQITDIVQQYEVTNVVHLACAVPGKKPLPRELEYSIDIVGTQNILDALALQKYETYIVVMSSGAAYGYHATHPEYISETQPLNGNKEWSYPYHKHLVENMLNDYHSKHPQIKQLILRAGTILGQTTDNQITNLFNWPFVLGIKGSESPFCFIWDQDVVDIIATGLANEVTGTYNLAGDGKLSMREISSILNKKYVNVSPTTLGLILKVLYKLKLSCYNSDQVRFLQYRPVLANDKLKEFYTPKKTSLETFEYYLQARDKQYHS